MVEYTATENREAGAGYFSGTDQLANRRLSMTS